MSVLEKIFPRKIKFSSVATTHLQKANLFFKLKNYKNAAVEYYYFLNYYPNHSEARKNLYNCLISLNKPDSALSLLKESIILDLDDDSIKKYMSYAILDLYKRSGDRDSVKKCYKAIIDCEPKNIDLMINLASMYFEDKDYNKAEELLKKSLKVNPKNEEAMVILGKVYFETRIFPTARLWFDRAVSVSNGRNSVAMMENALVLVEEREFAKAREHAEKVLFQDQSKETLFLAAFIFSESKDTAIWDDDFSKKGLKLLNQALTIDPKYANALELRAELLRRVSLGNPNYPEYAEAAYDLLNLVSLHPENRKYREKALALTRNLPGWEVLSSDLEVGININFQAEPAKTTLKVEPDASIEYVVKRPSKVVLIEEGADTVDKDLIGKVAKALTKKKLDSATQMVDDSLVQGPNSPEALYLKAFVSLASGHYRKAVAIDDKFINMSSNSPYFIRLKDDLSTYLNRVGEEASDLNKRISEGDNHSFEDRIRESDVLPIIIDDHLVEQLVSFLNNKSDAGVFGSIKPKFLHRE